MAATAGTGLQGAATPAAVLALAEAATATDGVAPLGEQNVLAVRHGTADFRHHWLADGDDLVGYAVVDPTGSAELCVHPDHRRRGLGRRLLDTVLAEVPDAAVWAHGDLPGAQALAAATGLRVVRELWQMGRELPTDRPELGGMSESRLSVQEGVAELGGMSESRLSVQEGVAELGGMSESRLSVQEGGVGVRTFVVGRDDDAWVELNARAFADHPEQGRLTVTDLRERQAAPWFDPSFFWLAHEAGRPDALLASMWVKAEGGTGEIYALGVAPEAQGRGLGGRLTDIAVEEMVQRGLARATLYVEGSNAAAIRTYRRAGFARTAVDTQYSR